MSASSVDIAIVGGGPSGTAAALTLLRYSRLRVVVLERSAYRETRIGETVSPAMVPLLEYLGAGPAFLGGAHLPAYATAAAWGSEQLVERDFLFSGRGHGWHLDRNRFDEMLAERVVEQGGTLLREARLERAVRGDGGWELTVAHEGGEPLHLQARYVIDASGRRASFAREQGTEHQLFDRLTAVIGFFAHGEDTTRPSRTLLETCEDGWWYAALLPGGRHVVAYMTDPEVIRANDLHEREPWLARLGRSGHVSRALEGAQLTAPLLVRPAHSHLLTRLSGPGWIAAGDAATAFDPLSSMGIGYAISSGIHAARAAEALLRGDPSPLEQYDRHTRHNYEQYLALRTHFYGMEQRWAGMPFWAARHGAGHPG